MDPAASEIIADIESAFAKVRLGEGIGIRQALAMDACQGERALKKARNEDALIRHWCDLPDETLADACQAMCFMDAAGIRFHLPAYMRWTLRNYATSQSFSVDHTLYALATPFEQFSKALDLVPLLDDSQKAVIARFVTFAAQSENGDWFDTEFAAHALKYWGAFLPK